MEERLRKLYEGLLGSQEVCVLATSYQDRPHTSLMAYATGPGLRYIYMASKRSSRKYWNMERNPRVSILVDNRRQGGEEGRASSMALTLMGTFQPIGGAEEEWMAREALISRHPHLKGFFEGPDIQPFKVAIEAFMLLLGPGEAHFQLLK